MDSVWKSSAFGTIDPMSERWAAGEPIDGNECIGFKAAELYTYPCNDSSYFLDMKTWDGTDVTKPGLGYICEAKNIPTLDSFSVCVIPFKHQGVTYDSCSFEVLAVLNPDGNKPWCATKVDEYESTVTKALCKDERSIMPYGSGNGLYCNLPFLFDGIYYDHCSRKDFSMQSKHAKYHWCPDPTNLTETEYISGWPVGACPEFLYPPDNGCPENYDPVTDEVCLRISAYPASYEDAKAKCVSEGGFLLQYTDSLIEVHMIQKFS